MLTEPQIQRYARQLLLRDVGERGQEALGAVEVDLALGGPLAAAAAAYLCAGGTEVHLSSTRGGPWAPTPPLLESAPRGRLHVVAAPGAPERAGVVVGSAGGAQVLWSTADDGCRACLRRVTGALAPPDVPEPSSVQLGSLSRSSSSGGRSASPPRSRGWRSRGPACSPRSPPRPAPTVRPPCPSPCSPSCVRHLAAALPDEGCAVLVGQGDRVRVVPMENAQAVHHCPRPRGLPPRAADRVHPRPPRLARPAASKPTGRESGCCHRPLAPGGRRTASRPRTGAGRPPTAQPLLPGVAHLVVAFEGGRPRGARWAVWSGGDFLEIACPLPTEPERFRSCENAHRSASGCSSNCQRTPTSCTDKPAQRFGFRALVRNLPRHTRSVHGPQPRFHGLADRHVGRRKDDPGRVHRRAAAPGGPHRRDAGRERARR